MNESTPPQGSSLPDQVDLTADVGPEGPLSAPAAKKARLSLQQQSSSGSSATGRPQGTLWAFFTRSSQKQNKSHYAAFCDPCNFAGTSSRVLGVSDSMKAHLQKCSNVPDAVHEWARNWSKDSEPYVADVDAADSGAATPSARSQSALQRFMSFKDVAMSDKQQEEFHMLLLQGTISGNLPFSWIDNEYIQAAFEMARPTVVLPGRRALSGLLCATTVCFAFVLPTRTMHAARQIWLVCYLKQLVALQRSCSRRLFLTWHQR